MAHGIEPTLESAFGQAVATLLQTRVPREQTAQTVLLRAALSSEAQLVRSFGGKKERRPLQAGVQEAQRGGRHGRWRMVTALQLQHAGFG